MYWVSGLLAGCPKKVSPHLSEETGMKLLTSLTAAGSNRDKGILFPAIGALLLLRGSFSVLAEVKQPRTLQRREIALQRRGCGHMGSNGPGITPLPRGLKS